MSVLTSHHVFFLLRRSRNQIYGSSIRWNWWLDHIDILNHELVLISFMPYSCQHVGEGVDMLYRYTQTSIKWWPIGGQQGPILGGHLFREPIAQNKLSLQVHLTPRLIQTHQMHLINVLKESSDQFSMFYEPNMLVMVILKASSNWLFHACIKLRFV